MNAPLSGTVSRRLLSALTGTLLLSSAAFAQAPTKLTIWQKLARRFFILYLCFNCANLWLKIYGQRNRIETQGW